MGVRLFIFDLAGTLIRDDGVTLEVYRALTRGLEASDDWFRGRMGMQKEQVFGELLTANGRDPADAQDMARRFSRAMADAFVRTPPDKLPGADETLQGLVDRGTTVAFNTGYSRETAEVIVRATGWTWVDLVTAEDVRHGRPAPDMIHESMRRAGVTDPRFVGVCGDTPNDLQAGQRAGCGLNIGIGHGTHALVDLVPHPHTHLLDDLSSIVDIVTS